jgi:signal peptidase
MIQKAGIAILLLLVIVLAAPAGAPLQVSYVSSDSMSPTIDTNDGYVLVPAPTVEAGDVITFYSEERETHVTHRAMQVTSDGIVTRGDGNPSTDQAAGYPLVQQADVSGKLLTFAGRPVVIPHLGTVLNAISSYWYLIVGALGAYLLLSGMNTDRKQQRGHVLRSREIVLPITILVIVAGVAFVTFGAVQQTQVYTVTEQPATDPTALTVGEPRTESITLRMTRSPFTHVVTETDGMEITNTAAVQPGGSGDSASQEATARGLPWQSSESSQQTITTRIPPQDTAGPHATIIRVHPYPAILPSGMIEFLHGIHPFVAALVTVLCGTLPLYLVYWLLVDTTTPLRRGRSRLVRRFGGNR